MKITIYNTSDTIILTPVVADTAVMVNEIMGAYVKYIEVSFSTDLYVELKRNYYITYNAKRYCLNKTAVPAINKATGAFEYNVQFVSLLDLYMPDSILWYYDTVSGRKEPTFTLTGTGDQFLQVIIKNIEELYGETLTIGEYPDEYKTVTFENVTLSEGLKLISDAYQTDWWITDDLIINLSSYRTGSEIDLHYDIELDDISTSDSSKITFGRMYAYGSTRNISESYYPKTSESIINTIKRLRLPSGTDYVTLPGLSNSEKEGVIIFEDIYPKRVGTITEIFTEILTKEAVVTTIYIFKDSNVIIDENAKQVGDLKVIFQSGHLNGREFGIKYYKSSGKYEIIYTNDGSVVPNPSLFPQVGDTYVLCNYDMSKYVDSIITELTGTAANVTLDPNPGFDGVFHFSCNAFIFDNSYLTTLAQITFTSGQFNGQSFQFDYDNNTAIYTVDTRSQYILLVNGDTFILTGLYKAIFSNRYILEAEIELLNAAQEYIEKQANEYVYECKSRSIFCELNDIDLSIGQRVKILSDVHNVPGMRIRKTIKNLLNIYDASFTIGDYVKYSRLKDAANGSANKHQVIIGNGDKTTHNANIIIYGSGTQNTNSGTGTKKTGIDAGIKGETSFDDDYRYICVQSGTAGSAIWKKTSLSQT
jgi:hypothetical protein